MHAYKTAILRASKVPSERWNSLDLVDEKAKLIIQTLLRLKTCFKKSRLLLKQMGECSGQGIEPDQQTALADDTEALAGVLCAGVPGAGGVDAIYAITLSPTARMGVERMWSERNSYGSFVCPLMLSCSSQKSGIYLEEMIAWE